MTSEINLWSERQRLFFVERMLFWRGYINRKDLIDRFGISAPQATNDLVNYSTRNPGCRYNIRAKRYEAEAGMEMVLLVADFGKDMEAVGSSIWPAEDWPLTVAADFPARVAPVDVLQRLTRAVYARESVEIRYWSANSGTAAWRRISPRGFGNDGLRWHVRAYCHNAGEFRDFNVGRMKGLRKAARCAFAEVVDEAWLRFGLMTIRVNPKLDAQSRKGLEMDYGMKRGVLKFPVREAMLTYAARRLGFTQAFSKDALPMVSEMGQLEWVRWEVVKG